MNSESTVYAKDEELPIRITRARTRALGRPPLKQEQKRVHQANSKRAASDENKASVVTTAGLQHKRRAVLTNVTNICEKSSDNCMDASNFQVCMKRLIQCKCQIFNIL